MNAISSKDTVGLSARLTPDSRFRRFSSLWARIRKRKSSSSSGGTHGKGLVDRAGFPRSRSGSRRGTSLLLFLPSSVPARLLPTSSPPLSSSFILPPSSSLTLPLASPRDRLPPLPLPKTNSGISLLGGLLNNPLKPPPSLSLLLPSTLPPAGAPTTGLTITLSSLTSPLRIASASPSARAAAAAFNRWYSA